ncbi:MAG TPA: DUF2367 domain-containing protein [Thermoanaerobaculia bacterium]
MAQVTCPKCSTLASQGGFPGWAITVSICFFPVGLLALLGGRNPTQCPNCGHTWQS